MFLFKARKLFIFDLLNSPIGSESLIHNYTRKPARVKLFSEIKSVLSDIVETQNGVFAVTALVILRSVSIAFYPL